MKRPKLPPILNTKEYQTLVKKYREKGQSTNCHTIFPFGAITPYNKGIK